MHEHQRQAGLGPARAAHPVHRPTRHHDLELLRAVHALSMRRRARLARRAPEAREPGLALRTCRAARTSPQPAPRPCHATKLALL